MKRGENLKPNEERLPSSKYCFLRQNAQLRGAIKHRMKDFNVTELCRNNGVNKAAFFNYVSGKRPKEINQWELIVMGKALGIDIGIKITFNGL